MSVLDVTDLDVVRGFGRRRTEVLHGVSFTVPAGTTLGVVGESGSGKSTLAKTIVGLVPVASGTVAFDGVDLAALSARERLRLNRRIQLIPQDPYASLNPRRTIAQSLAEAIDPVRADPRAHRETIAGHLASVLMDADAAGRYPHEFSGGQRQRIAIARALAVRPELILADEITSALDLTTQAEILNLLADLRVELGFTMLFISHNLAVVRHVSDAVLVLRSGRVVESGAADDVYGSPAHEYTRALLASVPSGPGFRVG